MDARYRARARAAFNRLKTNPMFAEVMEHIYLADPSDSAALQFPHIEIPKFEVPDYEHMPFGKVEVLLRANRNNFIK